MEYLYLSIKVTVTIFYSVIFLVLCAFGMHRYYLVSLYKKYRNRTPKPKGKMNKLPIITVQLPIYNEMYVVERLISSVCMIDYPKEFLEIQVLDDSIDETVEIARECVSKYRNLGYDIHYIHRENRKGFKAGALEEGLKFARGEFIAIFDADFLPSENFLKRTIDFFTDDKVGMVQVKWGHVNLDYSCLTKTQAILLDGHFMVEQTSRFRAGRFFNFNGTGGVLRRSCIESAGGWQHDTLTEDLDLSYRAQLLGWKFIYLNDVVANAELPVDINAFKSQQYRWAKGAIQTAKKLLPRIFQRRDLPLSIRIEALFHLLGNFSYLLLFFLILLMLPIVYFWHFLEWKKLAFIAVFTIAAGTVGIIRFYVFTLKEVHGKNWKRYAGYIPLAISLGTGIAINNSKAVVEALLGRSSEFKRTPKFSVVSGREKWHSKKYVSPKEAVVIFEFLVGLLFVFKTFYAISTGYFGLIPFFLIFQVGFFYTSTLSILHTLRRSGKGAS